MSVKVLRNGDLKAILVENYLRNNPNMKYQVITEISFEVFFFFLFSFFFVVVVVLCFCSDGHFVQRNGTVWATPGTFPGRLIKTGPAAWVKKLFKANCWRRTMGHGYQADTAAHHCYLASVLLLADSAAISHRLWKLDSSPKRNRFGHWTWSLLGLPQL